MREQQLLDRERLLEEVEGAELGRAHRGLDGAVAAHHHDRHAPASARCISSRISTPSRPGIAMSSSTRSGAASRRAARERGLAVRRLGGREALVGQQARERAPDALLVVDDQDAAHAAPPHARAAHGQLDDEARAARPVGVDAHVAVVVGDDARDDREAEAGAVVLASRSRARRCGGGPRGGCRCRRPRTRGAPCRAARRGACAARRGPRAAAPSAAARSRIAAIALSIRLVSTRRIWSRSKSTVGSVGSSSVRSSMPSVPA